MFWVLFKVFSNTWKYIYNCFYTKIWHKRIIKQNWSKKFLLFKHCIHFLYHENTFSQETNTWSLSLPIGNHIFKWKCMYIITKLLMMFRAMEPFEGLFIFWVVCRNFYSSLALPLHPICECLVSLTISNKIPKYPLTQFSNSSSNYLTFED